MLVIPAVDIRRGRCVQLIGGEVETEEEHGDPVDAGIKWVTQGASYLHLVDLDAAMGVGDNMKKVAEVLASVGVGVEVGGGIRSVDRGSEILGIGADRIILGTVALKDPDIVKVLARMAGPERIVVALDARKGKVTYEGWKKTSERGVIDVAKEFEDLGVGGILFTNVDREGRMKGIESDEIRELAESIDLPVIAAGGVRSSQDVKLAKEAGADALVIGKALYEGEITLKEAMEAAK